VRGRGEREGGGGTEGGIDRDIERQKGE
jgi:hypothetical protein